MVDLYFKHEEGVEKKEQFAKLWKSVFEELRSINVENSPKTCNFANPEAKFLLKINASMRNVRIFIK